MSGTLIVAVDGSAGAADAAALGAWLTGVLGLEAELVCVHPPQPLSARLAGTGFEDRDADTAARIVDQAPWPGGPVLRRAICAATPALGVRMAAEEREAELVVVGSSHRHGIGRAVPGSTAMRLVAELECPVAIAPAGWRPSADGAAARRIGVAFDGTRPSLSGLAVGVAVDLARHTHGSLELIDAVTPKTPADLARYGPAAVFFIGLEPALEEARDRLADALAALPPDVEATTQTPVGDAGQRLVEATSELDLLVMGSRAHGWLGRLIAGSASDQVAAGARCPLIVVPEGVRVRAAEPSS